MSGAAAATARHFDVVRMRPPDQTSKLQLPFLMARPSMNTKEVGRKEEGKQLPGNQAQLQQSYLNFEKCVSMIF